MGVTADEPQRIFVVTLIPMPGVANPVLALRKVLKIALRQFRLRCVNVEEKTEQRS
jgi:hypothetical protein